MNGHFHAQTLSAFIDGELASHEQQLVEQHLEGCHACTLRVVAALQMKVATARAGYRFAPSAEALARFQRQLHAGATKDAVRSFPKFSWLAVAAALIMAVALVGWRQNRAGNTLAAELLDQHLAVLSSGAVPEVISTDRHTVKPWFQGRLPFSFNIPDAAALPAETVLRGADLAYIEGQPAALLLFTIHKHEVSVFLTQRGSLGTGLPDGRAGFSIRTANMGNLRLIAVSDVNAAELDALVASVFRAQSGM